MNIIACFFQAFSVVFEKAIDKSEPAEEVKQRVLNLIDCITYSVFVYTSRGLFERDKIIFTAQMAFQVIVVIFLCYFLFFIQLTVHIEPGYMQL